MAFKRLADLFYHFLFFFVLLIAATEALVMLWGRHVAGSFRNTKTGKVFTLITIFPGVIFHETCHLIMGLMLFVRVTSYKPFMPATWMKEGGKIGEVQFSGAGFLRSGLIALAPIIGALGLMWLLVFSVFQIALPTLSTSGNTLAFIRETVRAMQSENALICGLVCCLLCMGWLPSSEDLKLSIPFLLFLLLSVYSFHLFSKYIQSNFQDFYDWGKVLIDDLASLFAFTALWIILFFLLTLLFVSLRALSKSRK